jgi:signal transduction histidine kinase/HPt (histidine-containing phosphotransfer) domain-containing protein/ActR/RegA family two-component response regulator
VISNRPPSIRVLFGTLLALVMVLAAGLFAVTSLQSKTASERTAAEHQRVNSFLLSDQMRQSSNDLTRMVRLYVTTGDPRYRAYYDEILAIRSGTARRPVDYDSSFWDRVLASGTDDVPTGPPVSLPELMRENGFSGAEFTALDASLRASDDLAGLEERVMDEVAPRIAEGVGRSYLGDVEPEYSQLVNQSYNDQKGRIMAAIDRFTTLVDDDETARENALQTRTDRLLVAQTGILVLLGITLLGTLALAARQIARPLARLTGVTRRITSGDWSQRAPAAGVAELRELAHDFNDMADAVENDLAGRRRAEQEAREARVAAESADRAKSAFLAMMSHELRTPLVAVTGTLEVLGLGSLESDQRELVDVATRSARSLLGVIGDVLDFSKIEAGYLDLTPVPTALGGLVEDFVAQHRLAAPGRAVELRTSIDPRLAGRHEVDPVRLRQVLGNLVGNALKFTREGSVCVRVEVTGESDGGGVQDVGIVVEDTGIGVSEDDQRRLFEPFEQASSDSARNGGGTGLGLVICRQLVEAMGGRVGMTSVVGEGTTMRVDLPLPVVTDAGAGALAGEAADIRLTRRALPARAAAEREGSLVLLVEDHPVNREILARQFEAIGFVTDTAADAVAATGLFEGSAYGLVFTDIQLPGADGYELARGLRALEEGTGRRRAPIVALTASALRGERERCLAAGMDDLVVKPATLATLAQALRRWLPGCAWPEVGGGPVGVGGPGGVGGSGGPAVDRGLDEAVDPSEPAIDRSALDELTGGDEELGREILTRYLESLDDDLEAVCRALRDGDVSGLRRHAHQIAGASRTVGAHAVAAEASRLERAAGQPGDAAELGRLAEGLRQTAAR